MHFLEHLYKELICFAIKIIFKHMTEYFNKMGLEDT